MKSENRRIRKELVFRGKVLKIMLSSNLTVKRLRFRNVMIKALVKGRAFTKKMNYSQEYIKRKDGTDLRVCIYTPAELKENAVGLLWIHGGGYAMGQPEQDIPFIKEFVTGFSCVVIAPEYTKSVEKPYPAALEDCYTALLWMKHNCGRFSINPDKLFIGGESAGGGLTAALSLYARDKGEVAVAFQMPIYPMLDDRPTASSANNNAPVWNTESNVKAWKLYLGDLYGKDVPKYAAPARETDYKGLPPALTYVGTSEPFYDETVSYIENLQNAGVDVHFRVFEGCFHGFDIVAPSSEPAKQAKEFLLSGFEYAEKNYCAKQPENDKKTDISL